MADRNLDVRLRVRNARAFNADTRKAERGIKSLSTATGRSALRARAGTRAMSGFTAGLRAMGRGALYAGGALAAGVLVESKRAIDEFREAGKVSRITEARIRSTGKAAGLSAQEIAAMSTDLSNLTAIDDEEIQRTANRLLTFTGIGDEIFKPALQAAIDMGAEFGDSSSKAIMLGKALQDPAKGATALRRAGVNLNEQQQEQLTKWVEQGDTLRAQRWILKELQTEFGGTAKANADAVDRIRVAWANTEEAIGTVIGPPTMMLLDTFSKRLIALQPTINHVGEGMAEIWDPKDHRSFEQNLALSRTLIRNRLGPVWDDVKDDIADAELDDKLLDAFELAVPRIAETMGRGGGRAMLAFSKGWLHAPWWSQLMTLSFLMGKFGAFAPLGRWAGGRFKDRFVKTTATGLVGATAAEGAIGGALAGGAAKSRWKFLGGKAGKVAGGAFVTAFLLALTTEAFRDELQSFFDDPLGYAKRSITGHDLDDPNKNPGRTRGGSWPDPRPGVDSWHWGPKPPRLKPPHKLKALEGGALHRLEADVPVVVKLNDRVLAEAVGRVAADRRARR